MVELLRKLEGETVYFRQLVVLGFRGVQAQGLRALLSALGITIGIAAVLLILAAGAGAREQTLRRIEALGTDKIVVRAARAAKTRTKTTPAESTPLSVGDAIRIRRIVGGIAELAVSRTAWTEVSTLDASYRAHLIATTPDLHATSRLTLREGRFLQPADGRTTRNVCVLGDGVKRRLFGLGSAVGESVLIHGAWHRVVGVLEARALLDGGQAEARGRDINRDVFVPLETVVAAGEVPADWEVGEIDIVVEPGASVAQTASGVRAVLARTHRGEKNYEVVVPHELLKQRSQTARTLNAVLVSIAGLSLLVGGIGIMNIMLATVTERTPEIGLRRAVGATASDVAMQFLIESATLTFLGGVLGVGLAILGVFAIRLVAAWPMVLSLTDVLSVLTASVLCGLVFGVYPALRAASAPPVDSLRYE